MPSPPNTHLGGQAWVREVVEVPVGDYRLLNEELHREDGPAFISRAAGQIRWVQHGKLSRDGHNPAAFDRVEGSRVERWRVTWPDGLTQTVRPTNARATIS